MKINLHCLSFYLSFKKFTKFQPIIELKQLKVGGKSHCEINAFSSSCWPQLLAPNYCNVLFPAQQLWVFSYNAWRVWRTPDKRSETISSYRISPDPSDSQLHVSTSSLQFTSLIFYRVQVRGLGRPWQKLHFVLSDPFCVWFGVCFGLLSWRKIQPRPIIRFLTESVRFRFFICWYLIESMMPCIWTRCSGPPAEKKAHNIKDPAVYLIVDMGHFLSLFVINPSGGVAAKRLFFSVSSDHRSQSHLKFQSCLTTEYAGDCFWMSEENFSWNPPEQHVVM